MKYIVFLIITALLFIQSCKTKEIEPNISGKVIAGDINGKTWQNTNFRIGYGRNCSKSISLNIWVNDEDRLPSESFDIKKIPLREGSLEIIKYNYNDYTINNNCLNDSTILTKVVEGAYYTLIGGDAIRDTYSVLTNPKEKNRLTVTKLDLQNNYIEGEFDATFLLKRDENGLKFYKDSADTLRFKGVKFQASIVNLM
jgi:hypothetical protein